MTEPDSYINGHRHDSVSVLDRGLHYGDGVFETIAVHQGRLLLWPAHWQRLVSACATLHLPIPDETHTFAELSAMVKQHERAVLKFILTRGSGGRGYAPPQSPETQRIALVYPWPEYPDDLFTKGAELRVCQTRLGLQPALAGMKHLNRLEQVIARAEWQDRDIFEGLMLDQNECVIEGTMSNLFVISAGELHTPDLTRCGIAGVMREQILEACIRLKIPAHEMDLSLEDVLKSDECFISNSIIGVVKVRKLEHQVFSSLTITEKIHDYLLSQQAFIRS